jgi:hypothetical protein
MATEVAKKESTAVAIGDFEEFGSLGFEETKTEDT